MAIYATIKQLAQQYQVKYDTIQLIVAEMHRSGHDGVIYVGRLPRIDIAKFEEYLRNRKECNNDLQGKVSE